MHNPYPQATAIRGTLALEFSSRPASLSRSPLCSPALPFSSRRRRRWYQLNTGEVLACGTLDDSSVIYTYIEVLRIMILDQIRVSMVGLQNVGS
jgi:hypothetical protein